MLNKLEWTKHHRPLQVPSIFQLPVCLDGETTRTEQYSLVGLLCHIGNAHYSGHFYAVYIFRGLYWLADDGSYPRALPILQDNIKKQIAQVWAMPSSHLLPSHIKCDFPTASKEENAMEPDAKRRCSHSTGFAFANVTSLGHDVRQCIGGRPRTPIFVVETHLNEEDHFKTMQWFSTRGFGAMGHPAAVSP